MTLEELLKKKKEDLHYLDLHRFLVTKGLSKVTLSDMDKIILKFRENATQIVGFDRLYGIVAANESSRIMKRWTIAIGIMTFVLLIATAINIIAP